MRELREHYICDQCGNEWVSGKVTPREGVEHSKAPEFWVDASMDVMGGKGWWAKRHSFCNLKCMAQYFHDTEG